MMEKEITKKGKKQSTTKKKTSAKNKKVNKFDSKKLVLTIILFVVIISSLFIIFKDKDEVVITIDNIKYTETDFNMYAYLVKYEYFGIDGTNLSEESLNTQVSSESDLTVREYLKERVISKIKVSASILRIANENNITLNSDAMAEIESDKNEFIANLGGDSAYKKMLKENNTTDEAYDEVAKVNKLYEIIYDNLYASGKRNDLTDEELENFTESYYDDYVKIKQIILLKKDLETGKYLDETVLNQKEVLASSLVDMAKSKSDFEELIIKYSEDQKEDLSEYYLKESLVDELSDAINNLGVGDISGVVSTDSAYHIVIREELDDAYMDTYLDSKREEKMVEDISDNLEKIAVVNSDYLEKITVN